VKDTGPSPPRRRGLRIWEAVRSPGRRAAALALLLAALAAAGAAALWAWSRPAGEVPDGLHHHWREAERALDADDLALARDHLQQCLQIYPVSAEAHFLLARLERRAENPAECLSHLGKAKALQWPKEEIDFERLLLQAQTGGARRAEAKLRERLESRPGDRGLILEALVKGYLEICSFLIVEKWTIDWIESSPDDWRPWYYRGRAYQLVARFGRAIADFRRVLELNPEHGPARAGLAGSLMMDGQFLEALAQFQHYLATHPDDPIAWMGVANSQASLGEATAARAALDRVTALGRETAGALLVRARLDITEGASEVALGSLKRAEALAPYDPDIGQAIVLALRQMRRHADADVYERKLRDLYAQLADLQALQRKALRDPDNLALRHDVGVFFLKLGRDEEAGRWLYSVLRLDPGHQATHQVLADYYAKLGDKPRAAYHRRQAGGAREGGSSLPSPPRGEGRPELSCPN
jgi:tetratricopeptide (TPR) repeat protein